MSEQTTTTVKEAVVKMAFDDRKMIELSLSNGLSIVGEIGFLLADGFVFNQINLVPHRKSFIRWNDVVCVTIL